MNRALRVELVASVSFAAIVACGTTLRRPPVGPHAPTEFVEVASKPPPPRAEDMTAPPEPRAVWIDGEWSWTGTRWTWRRGGWVLPPAGATFAPWEATIDATGRVLFAPGTWHDARGVAIEAPVVLGARRLDAAVPEGGA